jgi:hypothetical protein
MIMVLIPMYFAHFVAKTKIKDVDTQRIARSRFCKNSLRSLKPPFLSSPGQFSPESSRISAKNHPAA